MKLSPYPEYKDSGVEWIGDIPEGWETHRFKINFKYIKGRIPENLQEESNENSLPYLSMDYLRGKSEVLYSDNDPKAIKINDGDLLLLWDGSNAGEFVEGKKGYLSSTMVKLSLENIDLKYSNYLCRAFEPLLRDLTIGMGIPHVNGDNLGNIRITHPNIKEQKSIVSFLDKKTSEIDKIIEKDTRLIELLQEKRTALINHVVTKGLDPEAPMKDSGIEWIGEIPEEWESRRIRTLSLVRRGASPRPIDDPKYFDVNGEYSWVRISDVTASNKYLNKTSEKLSALGKSLSVPLEPGVLFISIAASVGKPIISNIKCCIHDGFIYFQNLEVNQEYLFYIFIGGQAFQGLGKLGTQLNLNTETIAGITIPVPTKDEQRQIAQYIDKETQKIDLTINKIQNNITLLQEYKKSIIHHVVTGKVDVRDVV
jgi:type I restriction enzyme S subunit